MEDNIKLLANSRLPRRARSILIVLAILALGFLVELISAGSVFRPVSAPYNIYIGFAFTALLLYSHFQFGQSAVVRWLSSVPAALGAIAAYGFLALLMGFIPQTADKQNAALFYTGLNHIKLSWEFLFVQLYILTSLGFTVIRRIWPFNFKNFGFFLSHFGLWLILFAAGLGAGDIQRLTINVIEKEAGSDIGISERGEIYRLPFELKLVDFSIDEYPPQLCLVDAQTGEIVSNKGDKLPTAEPGKVFSFGNIFCKIDSLKNDVLVPNDSTALTTIPGGCFAARIKAWSSARKDSVRGWIACGNYMQSPRLLRVSESRLLALTMPRPRKFSSTLLIYKDSVKVDSINLCVNQPYDIDGWTIYQTGYDQSKGKWSVLSVIEAVSDPWLPLIYTGIGLLLAGAVFMFWMGSKK